MSLMILYLVSYIINMVIDTNCLFWPVKGNKMMFVVNCCGMKMLEMSKALKKMENWNSESK